MLERFYRVPGTTGEGTGLGLAIADRKSPACTTATCGCSMPVGPRAGVRLELVGSGG